MQADTQMGKEVKHEQPQNRAGFSFLDTLGQPPARLASSARSVGHSCFWSEGLTPLSAKGNAILRIAAPEKNRTQHMGHLVAGPVFAQHVGRVLGTRDVPEIHNLSGDGFSYPMIGESGPTFVELGVRNAAAGNHGFVITEHHRTIDGDTEITEGEAKINDLISGGAGSNELGSTCGSLHGVLFLAAEIQDSLVHGVHNTGDGSTGEEVMVEIGVDPGSGDDRKA